MPDMKAKLLFTISFVLLLIAGCTETGSDEYCSDPGATCPDDTNIEATACCTDQSCYWVYNGTNYNCDGKDCNTALTQIINSACSSPSGYFDLNMDLNNASLENLRAQMQKVTDQLMEQARMAAGCEYQN